MTDRFVSDLAAAVDETLPLEARVAAGARLWDASARAKVALESLKTSLREEALRRSKNEPGVQTIEGVGMSRAFVTIPEPKLELAKEADIKKLRQVLGAAGFNAMFEEVVTYKVRPGSAASYIASATPEVQKVAFASVVESARKPRVSFQFGGDVSPIDESED